MRFSYNRAHEGKGQKEIRNLIKLLKNVNLNSWFIQCAVLEGVAIQKRNKDRKLIFGGKNSFTQRIENKIDKEELKCKRLNKITLQGEAIKFGNRMFNFKELENNKLIFKVSSGVHAELELQPMKENYKKKLLYIQHVASLKEQPITISLDSDYVYFTYEEPKVRNFRPNSSRTLAIDMNPNQIGLSIMENSKLIYTQQFDLFKLTQQIENEPNASDSLRFKHLNNKLKHEIIQISKKILEIALTYKVHTVFVEKLNGILKSKKENIENGTYKGNAFNRKVGSFWKRSLFINNLKKRCILYSIGFHEIFPQYSSFIGNLMHDFTDPINASLEINRRGNDSFLAKNKKKFYPELIIDSLKDQWKEYLGDDVKSWVELKHKNPKMKYRVSLDECIENHSFEVFEMDSIKSKVICYNFV